LTLVDGAAIAQITAIDPWFGTSPSPFFPGTHYYSPVFDNNQYGVNSLKWEIKCLQPGATYSQYTTLYEATDTSPTLISLGHYVSHRIKCTSTYASNQAHPVAPDPTFVELDIDVVKPNKTTIIQGLNAAFNRIGTKKVVVFQIQYNDTPFSYVIGWPQEMNSITFPYSQLVGWVPDTQAGLDPLKYSLRGNTIGDFKDFPLLVSLARKPALNS
jgi:aromatic ring-cleaving dioxygenase